MAIVPRSNLSPLSMLFIIIGIFLVSVSIASELDYPEPNKEQDEIIVDVNNQLYDHYAFDKCRSLQAQPFDQRSHKKKLIIIGDSQGCDFLNGMIENGYLKQYQVQFRFIPYACQRVPYEKTSLYISAKHHQLCLKAKRIDSLEKTRQQVKKADVIIFAALWKARVAQKMPKIFHYLGIKKPQKIVVIGYKFFGKMLIKNYANLSQRERHLVRNDVGNKALKINTILKNSLGNKALFINPHQLVCGDTTSCPVFTNALELISYDGRHLTKAGARYMGKILFQRTKLGSI
jgi:hypothetical protein